MPSADWLREYRRRRFEYNPWCFPREATAEEQAEQTRHHHGLAEVAGVVLGEGAYVAPSASVTGGPGSALHMGARGFVGAHAYVTDRVTLGDDCSINPFATLRGPITGGHGVRIGAYACLVGFNHGHSDPDRPIFQQAHTSKGIVLGDDIWIGAHVTVVDGVKVGSHCILAAGAVVTRDVPDYAIVGGNPARVLRLRKPRDDAPPGPRRYGVCARGCACGASARFGPRSNAHASVQKTKPPEIVHVVAGTQRLWAEGR